MIGGQMANSTANVSVTKGVRGGYIYIAPLGTTLPTEIDAALDTAFSCLGYISEDGYIETLDRSSDDIKDLNGDVIASPVTSEAESADFTLAEVNADVLKLQYGSDNVTSDGSTITVRHNSDHDDEWSIVLRLQLKDGRRWDKVVPHALATELGELTLNASNLCMRSVTVKYLPDDSGHRCYDYIEAA